MDAEKFTLCNYLQRGRDALLWKLEGLSPYDARRPLVPTGTNLAGLVKHLAGVEFGYLGEVFGRPVTDPPEWLAADEPNADMYAADDESVADAVALYRRAWAHSDATIEALPLDAPGIVPWWGEEHRQVTLHQVLVHVIAETHRHAGHADLVRELVDGRVGYRAEVPNLPPVDDSWWRDYAVRLERIAAAATE